MGRIGVTSFANFLKNPASRIESLQLGDNSLDDEYTSILVDALLSSNSLRKLYVCGNSTFSTAAGWSIFCSILAHPMCTLEYLQILVADIGDEGIEYLGDALADNTSLKFLRVDDEQSSTSAGWQESSNYLRNPNSALQVLDISGWRAMDKVVVAVTFV